MPVYWGIAEAFAEYYERLYESRVEFSAVECADLLKDVSLRTLTPEDRDELEEELSEEESVQALRELQSGKAAGRMASRLSCTSVWPWVR
ncbi:hypothetical protein NDU88_000151 [Pleurodeles waltl]|uniref:Uncharacterized protein n=1 Tax=Pleurodeles waltl TaxID=8319 RepID=A0AAV7SVI7_PLEWA|nr:hypothetical protein NDU88_000151 [Pleurodeles waltl]